MSSSGPGLYASDFARDLRTTVKAVSRLPLSGPEVLSILSTTFKEVAERPTDPDFTTFWLVVADQFKKNQIDEPSATIRALEIIRNNSDIANLKGLGASDAYLSRRTVVLSALAAALQARSMPKKRALLKHPQPFLLDLGQLLVYPVSQRGMPIVRHAPWEQAGWGATLVVDRGRAFDFLAWYTVMTVTRRLEERPRAEALMDSEFLLGGSGTLSKRELREAQIDAASPLTLDEYSLTQVIGPLRPGTYAAINEVTLLNGLIVAPAPRFENSPRPASRTPVQLRAFAHPALDPEGTGD